jgi:hypothetical protein
MTYATSRGIDLAAGPGDRHECPSNQSSQAKFSFNLLMEDASFTSSIQQRQQARLRR